MTGPRSAVLVCIIFQAAAVPFFRNTFAGDTLFTAVLFGGFALVERLLPALREQSPQQPQAA